MSTEPDPKGLRTESGLSKKDAAVIVGLQEQVAMLQHQLDCLKDESTTYYASKCGQVVNINDRSENDMPKSGMPADHVKELILQHQQLDFKPRLNTSSYVNVVSEPQERDIALLGLEINLADASVYPASVSLHDKVVSMIACLWHAPPPPSGDDYCGSGTVGSTEACLLAGLALKFRWRKWYATRNSLSDSQVRAILPNIVITTCYQAAWEKFFRYFDVQPRFVKPTMLVDRSSIDPGGLAEAIDENTIAVVGVMGNHYNGVYDPIWDIDKVVARVNREQGLQVGIHVDAASGGFIAPFQEQAGNGPPAWDFRLPNVLSISASGHKFGESICGTGWVVFRHRKNLAEHIAVSGTLQYSIPCCIESKLLCLCLTKLLPVFYSDLPRWPLRFHDAQLFEACFWCLCSVL
jgi:glutamate decarboxylase